MSSLGSFFDAGNCSSSSDDDSDAESTSVTVKQSQSRQDESAGTGEKLPSPTSVLLNAKRPEFLRSADELARRDLISEKRDQLEKDREYQTGVFAPKVPAGEIPARSVLPSATVSSKAVHYTHSTANNHVDSSGLSAESGSGSASVSAVKRAAAIFSSGNMDSGEPSAKKAKESETFREKEKRKRNIGQTSRGTSYIEEEKRLLRESGAT